MKGYMKIRLATLQYRLLSRIAHAEERGIVVPQRQTARLDSLLESGWAVRKAGRTYTTKKGISVLKNCAIDLPLKGTK